MHDWRATAHLHAGAFARHARMVRAHKLRQRGYTHAAPITTTINSVGNRLSRYAPPFQLHVTSLCNLLLPHTSIATGGLILPVPRRRLKHICSHTCNTAAACSEPMHHTNSPAACTPPLLHAHDPISRSNGRQRVVRSRSVTSCTATNHLIDLSVHVCAPLVAQRPLLVGACMAGCMAMTHAINLQQPCCMDVDL